MYAQRPAMPINIPELSADRNNELNCKLNGLLREGFTTIQIGAIGDIITDIYKIKLLSYGGLPERPRNWYLYYSDTILKARSMAQNAATEKRKPRLNKEEAQSTFKDGEPESKNNGQETAIPNHAESNWSLRIAKDFLRNEALIVGLNAVNNMYNDGNFKEMVSIAREFSTTVGDLAVDIYDVNRAGPTITQMKFDAWKVGLGVAGVEKQEDGSFRIFLYYVKKLEIGLIQKRQPESIELEWETGNLH